MAFKLLSCSDTHLALPPKLDETDATAWLHAGDVYDRCHSTKGQKGVKPQKLLEWFDERKLPVYAVKGNHDCSFDMPFFDKCQNATGRCYEAAPGLLIIGIGWSGGAYYDLPTNREIKEVIEQTRREYTLKSKTGDKVVILTHYPPWAEGMYDYGGDIEGWMYESIMELSNEVKAVAVIQGHVHDLFGTQQVRAGEDFETLIVSPGPCGGVLTIDEAGVKFSGGSLDPEFFIKEDAEEEEKEE